MVNENSWLYVGGERTAITAAITYTQLTKDDMARMKTAGFNTLRIDLARAWDISEYKTQIELAQSEGLYVIVDPHINWAEWFLNKYDRQSDPTLHFISSPLSGNKVSGGNWFGYSTGYDPNNSSTYDLTTGNTFEMENAAGEWIREVVKQLGSYSNVIGWAMKNCPSYGDDSMPYWYDWNVFALREFVYEHVKTAYGDVSNVISVYSMPSTVTTWEEMVQWISNDVLDPYTFSSGPAPSAFTQDFLDFRIVNSADFWNWYADEIRANDNRSRPITTKNSVGGDKTGHTLQWYDMLYDGYDVLGCEADLTTGHASWIYGLLRQDTRWQGHPLWAVEVEAWRNWSASTWDTLEANVKSCNSNYGLTGLWWSTWESISSDSYKLQRVTQINNWLIQEAGNISS